MSILSPLLIPHIFSHVLDYLVLPASECPVTSEERRTLAALARTCYSFTESFLDRLWWRLESLRPLVHSFADNVDEIRVKTRPSPDEWTVINRYHHRIREVTLGPDYLSLHFLRCTNLVLPNLRVLRWEPGRRDYTTTDNEMVSLSTLWPLFVSQIDTLELMLDYTTLPEFEALVENYPILCPNLNSIKFKLLSTAISVAPRVLPRVICSHTNWKRVEISCPIDTILLKHLGLSCKPDVVSLILDPLVESELRLDDAGFGSVDVPFRSTTRMAMTVMWSGLDAVTRLLCPHDQAFDTFEVTLQGIDATIVEISAFFTAILSPRRIQSLRSLALRQLAQDSIPVDEEQTLSYELLRPIISLVHLRELVVSLIDLVITIDDNELVDLIRNWPCLEVFYLMGMSIGDTKTISLKGLLSLLVRCPRLREIGLTVDARRIPSVDDVSALGGGVDIRFPDVTRLILQDAPIRDSYVVEEFLSKYLPNTDVKTMRMPYGQLFHQQLWYLMNLRWLERRALDPPSSTLIAQWLRKPW